VTTPLTEIRGIQQMVEIRRSALSDEVLAIYWRGIARGWGRERRGSVDGDWHGPALRQEQGGEGIAHSVLPAYLKTVKADTIHICDRGNPRDFDMYQRILRAVGLC
jgi:hypothetical protein